MSPNTHFTPLILAGIALLCGLSVANVYFNQALLPVFAGALHADAGQTSWIATASQMGYALGMLLIVPLGDRVAPLRLCRLLLVWTAALLLLAGQATAGERSRVIAWVQRGWSQASCFLLVGAARQRVILAVLLLQYLKLCELW